jgi:hypothetical protein
MVGDRRLSPVGRDMHTVWATTSSRCGSLK